MIWLVLVLCLMFLYGSFMMVRPGKRDRQTAALRQKAISLGLQVRLASRLKLLDELSRADMVCLLRSREAQTDGEAGSCFRNAETGKIRCYGSFSGLDAEAQRLFAQLPAGAEALIGSDSFVGVCWDERGDDTSVEKIASVLVDLAQLAETH